MKRLLQRIEDGRYYSVLSSWTDNPTLAYSFSDSAAAIRCCIEHRLPAMQLVLESQNPPFYLVVPLFIAQANNNWAPSLNAPRLGTQMLRALGDQVDSIRDSGLRSQSIN